MGCSALAYTVIMDSILAPASTRCIAHLDMDAFFASVSLLRYPQLRGLPVVIGGSRAGHAGLQLAGTAGLADADLPVSAFARLRDYVGRGVITTATYEARAFGVGSAMGLMAAAKRCPEAILLPADFERYRSFSRRFKACVLALTAQMEDRGIDEVYMDLSDHPLAIRDGGESLARTLQADIRRATGLSCSIGLAPNKLLAKLASDLDKPAGITRLDQDEFFRRLGGRPCRALHGIGPQTDVRLQAMGILTIRELAETPLSRLQELFGRRQGQWLHDASWGRDDRPLTVSRDPVSMSRETTFARDRHPRQDRAALTQTLESLCQRLADDLQRKGCCGRTVGIKIRYDNFQTVTREVSVSAGVASASDILLLARQALRRVPLTRSLRLLGVRVGALQPRTAPINHSLLDLLEAC